MALSPAVFLGRRSERTRAVGRSDALRSAQTSLRTASLRTDCSALSWMRSDSTQLQSSRLARLRIAPLADVLLCCDLPQALDAGPVVQLDAFPLRKLPVFRAHPSKLAGLGRPPQGQAA